MKDHFNQVCSSDMFGMHVCSIYRDRSEQMQAAIPYIAGGLLNNKKCIYITAENTKEELCPGLEACGVDTKAFIESGQLVFSDKQEVYLKGGFFVPFRMLDLLAYTHYETLKAGYLGLRVSGEMSWALEGAPGANRLVAYENQVNDAFYRLRISGLCQYDETRFPEELLLGVLYTHPKVVIYGELYDNPFYIPPERFVPEGEQAYRPGYYQELRDRIIAGIA